MEKYPNGNDENIDIEKWFSGVQEELAKERQKTQEDFDREEMKELGKKASAPYKEQKFYNGLTTTTLRVAPGYEKAFGDSVDPNGWQEPSDIEDQKGLGEKHDKKVIKEDYKESYLARGKSEEEFEAFWRLKELEEQRLELERQRLKLEHELAIARQERETKKKIAELEDKKERGKLGDGGDLLLKILKELDEKRNWTQADFDREEE